MRKSHRKYLRWDLHSTRIIVNINDNISVNIYDNDLGLLPPSDFIFFMIHNTHPNGIQKAQWKFWITFWSLLLLVTLGAWRPQKKNHLTESHVFPIYWAFNCWWKAKSFEFSEDFMHRALNQPKYDEPFQSLMTLRW